MPEAPYAIAIHEDRFRDLQHRLQEVLGALPARALLEKAISQAARKHPELARIEPMDDELSFEAVEEAFAGKPGAEVAEVFYDLLMELVLALADLLGMKRAQRESAELVASLAQER